MQRSSASSSKRVQISSGSTFAVELLSSRLPDGFPIAFQQYHHTNWKPEQHLHVHDCVEIGICRAGSGAFIVEEKIIPFVQGNLLIASEREMHGFRNSPGEESDWEFLVLNPAKLLPADYATGGEISTASLSGPSFPNILSADDHPMLLSLAGVLFAEMKSREQGYEAVVRGLVWSLLGMLHRIAIKAGPQKHVLPERKLDMSRIAPALNHIADRYSEPIRMRTLCNLCHMSPSSLQRTFRRTVGMTPAEYLAHFRTRMAAALLQSTTRTVLDIALSSGYPTQSSFYRQFRRITGLSPREWRAGPRTTTGNASA